MIKLNRIGLLIITGLTLSVLLAACAGEETRKNVRPVRPCPVEVLALAPFQAGIPSEEEGGVVCPICAEIFVGERIAEKDLATITALLPATVESAFSCQFIQPSRLAWQMPSEIPQNPGLAVRQVIAKAGREVGAEAVLVGVLFRFEERQGSDMGITRAASVSLALYLIDVRDASIIWQGFFNETQKSLSENLFKLSQFFQRGGRWLTASELAQFGILELLERVPVRVE
jgi:hypothetical protein